MRVGFDFTHAELSGTGLGRYPSELRPVLDARPEVDLVALSEPVADRADRRARVLRGLWREGTWYPARLALAARRAGADLVHCPTLSPVAAPGLPLVVTIHDLLPLSMPELFTASVRAHVRLSTPFARRATRILTNSEWTRAEVIERLGVPPERVVATPFGRSERFSPGEADSERLARRFGIRGPYVLCVATREPRKNLVSVLDAYERVARELGEVELVLAGGAGWLGEELDAALASAGPRVRRCGYVTDAELIELYRGATCFAFPSLAEGFGLPPLEAMACGAPVICSDRGALGEVVADAALLVEPTDVEALAAAMRAVLTDAELAADLRERGLARSAGFTWQRCAEETVGAYREALASTSA